jgi:hypothetical protein
MDLAQFQEKEDLVNWIYVEHSRRVRQVLLELRETREITSKQIAETAEAIIEQSLIPVYKKYVITLAHPPGGVTSSIKLDRDTAQLTPLTREVSYTLELEINIDGDKAYNRLTKTAKLPVSEPDLWEVYHSLRIAESEYAHKITVHVGTLRDHKQYILGKIQACLTEISFDGACADLMSHPKMVELLTIT